MDHNEPDNLAYLTDEGKVEEFREVGSMEKFNTEIDIPSIDCDSSELKVFTVGNKVFILVEIDRHSVSFYLSAEQAETMAGLIAEAVQIVKK